MRFHEVQGSPKGMKVLFWSVLGFTTLIALVVGFVQVQTDQATTVGDLLVMATFMVILPAALLTWMLQVRQEVQIDDHGVRIHQRKVMFKPKVIPWSDVSPATIRRLDSIGEFGGWGIRYGLNGKWGYILDGKSALELTLNNGKKRVVSIVDGEGARQALIDLSVHR